MNLEKRYCKNRVSKRKKTVETDMLGHDSEEEERQFKLSRFVKDVYKFVEENENSLDKKTTSKETSPEVTYKTFKKTQPAKPQSFARRNMFHNGIQTKFYTRRALGKEITTKLDENLQQIIALANNEKECKCSHVCKYPSHQPTTSNSVKTQREPLQQLQQSLLKNPTPLVGRETIEAGAENQNPIQSLEELDKKLYPEFTRIVSVSCIESKSLNFRNKSYVAAVKNKLQEIYLQGKKNSQELSCPSDMQKSSISKSSLGNQSPLTDHQPGSATSHIETTSDSEQIFTGINFVPVYKSSRQFLEETIGPGSSSCKSMNLSPEQQPKRTQFTTARSSRLDLSREHKYPCEIFPTCPPSISPNYDFSSMMMFDGGGDRLPFNPYNHFLPPVQEDSPEFHYFPRRMF